MALGGTTAGVLALNPTQNADLGSVSTGSIGVKLEKPAGDLAAFSKEAVPDVDKGTTLERFVRVTSTGTAAQKVTFALEGGKALSAGQPRLTFQRCPDTECAGPQPVSKNPLSLEAGGEATVKFTLTFDETVPAKAAGIEISDLRIRARIDGHPKYSVNMAINPLKLAKAEKPEPSPSTSGTPSAPPAKRPAPTPSTGSSSSSTTSPSTSVSPSAVMPASSQEDAKDGKNGSSQG